MFNTLKGVCESTTWREFELNKFNWLKLYICVRLCTKNHTVLPLGEPHQLFIRLSLVRPNNLRFYSASVSGYIWFMKKHPWNTMFLAYNLKIPYIHAFDFLTKSPNISRPFFYIHRLFFAWLLVENFLINIINSQIIILVHFSHSLKTYWFCDQYSHRKHLQTYIQATLPVGLLNLKSYTVETYFIY